MTAAARYLYIWRGGELPDSPVLGSPVAILVLFLVLFFFGGSVNEEFGWRGYALDQIQVKHNALSEFRFQLIFTSVIVYRSSSDVESALQVQHSVQCINFSFFGLRSLLVFG